MTHPPRTVIFSKRRAGPGPAPRRHRRRNHAPSDALPSLPDEDFIREQVLPRYANTHTESSGTGLQTTRLRVDARQLISDAVGVATRSAAPATRLLRRHPRRAHHLVIFCGSGTTAAVNKLTAILELRSPAGPRDGASRIPPQRRPAVFVGPYEHHSYELPWRESFADACLNESGRSRGSNVPSEVAEHPPELDPRPRRFQGRAASLEQLNSVLEARASHLGITFRAPGSQRRGTQDFAADILDEGQQLRHRGTRPLHFRERHQRADQQLKRLHALKMVPGESLRRSARRVLPRRQRPPGRARSRQGQAGQQSGTRSHGRGHMRGRAAPDDGVARRGGRPPQNTFLAAHCQLAPQPPASDPLPPQAT